MKHLVNYHEVFLRFIDCFRDKITYIWKNKNRGETNELDRKGSSNYRRRRIN
jgi:hypothetical protein